jgi:endonuclease/exonuclease/phosphatase family metal-dependent hydrolase
MTHGSTNPTKEISYHMTRSKTANRAFATAVAALVLCLGASAAQDNESKRVLKFMTRNMDAGTDLNLIFYYYPDIPTGVSATLEQVISTDLPSRAKHLADEIRTNQPDFIALQEVTTWRTGACGKTAVLYDQLQLLLDALAARHMAYSPLVVDSLVTIEKPALTGCVSFEDRNALLVRTDLRPTGIEISNVHTYHYASYLDLTSIGVFGFPPIYHGYMYADIKAGSDTFRLFNTHMESTYVFDPTGLLQVAQAGELVAALNATKLPVVLCGDFNSNAEPGPEQTATVGMILGAGFSDVWRLFNRPLTGYTWPLYYEDLANGPATPVERIDLIFTRGVRALKVDETGLTAPFASDHAGVVAMMQIGK